MTLIIRLGWHFVPAFVAAKDHTTKQASITVLYYLNNNVAVASRGIHKRKYLGRKLDFEGKWLTTKDTKARRKN